MNEELKLPYNSENDEDALSTETALTLINAEELNKECLDLINQIIAESDIEKTKDRIEHIKDLAKKHGDILTLGGILFLIYGNEVLSLVGGSYKELMEFQSAYNLHFEMMKYAIENPAELLTMGVKGRQYFKENYTIDKHLVGLEAHFKKICADK
jgi:lipid II:glycine glycyltransferase (peptidoglycan interpeptide bridge formation enzyme)